jgi:hypothetical protein
MTAGHLNAMASGERAQGATAEQVIREITEEKVWDAPYSDSTKAFQSILLSRGLSRGLLWTPSRTSVLALLS